MQVPRGEPLLILVLAGGLVLHQGRPALEDLPGTIQVALATAELALPALIAWPLQRWLKPELWQRGLYSLLPLLLGLLLARHLPIGMTEAGLVLQVGMGPNWFGWSADPHVVEFCQSASVLAGLLGTLVLSRRMLYGESQRLWQLSSLAIALGWGGRWLVH